MDINPNAANADVRGLPLIHFPDNHFFSVGLIVSYELMMCALRKPRRVIHARARTRPKVRPSFVDGELGVACHLISLKRDWFTE